MPGSPLSEDRCHWWQLSSKWHLLSSPDLQGRSALHQEQWSQDVSPFHGLRSPRNTSFMQALDALLTQMLYSHWMLYSHNALLTQRRVRARSVSTVGITPQWPAADAGWVSAHTRLMLQAKDSALPRLGIDIVVRSSRYQMIHQLRQTQESILSEKGGIPTQGDKPSTAVRAL